MFWHSSAMVVSFSTSYIERETKKNLFSHIFLLIKEQPLMPVFLLLE